MKVQCLYTNARSLREYLASFSTHLGSASLLSTMMILVFSPVSLAKDINWDGLNLSPQQETQIHQLENTWERTHDDVSTQIQRDMAELRQILPTGDSQRIRQLQNRITQNKMYLLNQSMDTFLKKRETLTPGQRQQLQKMMPAKSN